MYFFRHRVLVLVQHVPHLSVVDIRKLKKDRLHLHEEHAVQYVSYTRDLVDPVYILDTQCFVRRGSTASSRAVMRSQRVI